MQKFERDGIAFTSFFKGGKRYLCTGEPTGGLKFAFMGEICDYYTVEGATSVVSGDENISIDELYAKWLDRTEFERSLGVEF